MKLYIDFTHDRPGIDHIKAISLTIVCTNGPINITWDRSTWEYADGQTAGWCEDVYVDGYDITGCSEELNNWDMATTTLQTNAEDKETVGNVKILNLIFEE